MRTRCTAGLAHRASPSECAAELEGAGWQSVERSVDGDVTAIGTFILARSDNPWSEVQQTFLERLRAECEGRVERRRVHERATALPCSRARYVLAPRQLRSPPRITHEDGWR